MRFQYEPSSTKKKRLNVRNVEKYRSFRVRFLFRDGFIRRAIIFQPNFPAKKRQIETTAYKTPLAENPYNNNFLSNHHKRIFYVTVPYRSFRSRSYAQNNISRISANVL